MIKLFDAGIYLVNGSEIVTDPREVTAKTGKTVTKEEALKGTMAYSILKAHNTVDNMDNLQMKFDSMTSHDITYVGIIQTARASGMKEFPLPYVLTNCHNSLCAVGGTINEDDHKFALSAAHVLANDEKFPAYAVKADGTVTEFSVSTGALTEPERQIIADGCLINYYRNN